MMSEERQDNIGVSNYQTSGYYEDEIDLWQLFRVIWAGKWVIASVTILFAAASVVISLSLPNVYRSEALLAGVPESEGGGLAGLSGQFSGLANLAGFRLGGDALGKVGLALEIVKSRAFLSKFIARHQLQVPLMATKGWDFEAGEWLIDNEVYDLAGEMWVRDTKHPEPTDLELHRVFLDKLSISQSKDTGIVTIAIESQSPVEAQRWLNLLIGDLNKYIRKNDMDDAKANIAYLKEQLKKTSVAEMQRIFYQLIEQQTKTIMLAEAKDEYVLKIIDPPFIPDLKVKPKRALICIVGTLLGGLLSIVYVLIMTYKGKVS